MSGTEKMYRQKLPALLLLLVSLLAGCTATSYRGITVSDVISDVPLTGMMPAIQTFEVAAVNIPVFLGPIIVSNFSVALAERGLQPVSADGDVVVTLTYEQSDMEGPGAFDEFSERIARQSETRFVARIRVQFRTSPDAEPYWEGSIQRLHTVYPGDYMHTGNASVALLEAFRDLLKEYPQVNRNTEKTEADR